MAWPQRFSLLLSIVFLSAGCGGLSAPEENSETQSSEPSYCSTPRTYSTNFATVTGIANYEYRAGSPTSGLSATLSTAGIPYAEIQVKNSSGETVQCAHTDENGAFSLRLPRGNRSYTLMVNSRSDTNFLKATVFRDYYRNDLHQIGVNFDLTSSSSNVSVGTITARARRKDSSGIEGGAFNILRQFYLVNKYIREETNNSNFVAPKVKAYWKAGFNPYTYFGGSASDGISFYVPSLKSLFILGGISGQVATADTDHFDNTIIIHEYGHFLEDVLSASDSPGGFHDGDSIIDPRLAWSEGWANFLQAAVLGTDYYLDTIGHALDAQDNNQGLTSGGVLLNFDFDQDGGSASEDSVNTAGEGVFRELAISRFLLKTLRSTTISFQSIWEAFTFTNDGGGQPIGLRSSKNAFRNVGLYNEFLRARIQANATDSGKLNSWETGPLANERQATDTRYYASPLDLVSPAANCALLTLEPSIDNSYDESNLFVSNHFYRYDHDGTNKSIRLTYTETSGRPSSHLDLFLFKEDYTFQEYNQSSNGTVARSSARSRAIDGGTEQISLSGLAAGRYLINVRAYTYNVSQIQLGEFTYRLERLQNTMPQGALCPRNRR